MILDSALKSRDITSLTKVYRVKAVVFPVVMYGSGSWTIKKAECWKIDAFKLCCWRRLLRVPWTARRSNQSILKEISPEYSLQGLRLKLQYFVHLMWRTDSLEKTPILGKIEGRRRRGRQRMRWMASLTQWTWVWASSGSWWWTGSLAWCSPWGHEVLDMTEWLNWTDITNSTVILFSWNIFVSMNWIVVVIKRLNVVFSQRRGCRWININYSI